MARNVIVNGQDDDATAAAVGRRARRDELGERAASVGRDVDALEAQVIADREVIAHPEAEGVIDREKIANLERALVSARRIGAAMGVLMQAHKITDLDAFDLLRLASQRSHRKLPDVAEDVLLTGALPVPMTER
jgi:hypothetical protein